MTVPASEPQSYTDLIPRPDPTKLTDAAIERATAQYRRELGALRELHDKDLAALTATLDARLAGMDQDRARLWERIHELPGQQETANNHFRDDVARRDAAGRELIEQRLADLDKARVLAAGQIGEIPGQQESRLTAEREFILSQLEIIATRMTEKFAAIDEQFSASKTAVDAALSAAKEAVAEQNKANSAAIKVSEGNTKEQLTSLGQVSSANFKAMEDKIGDARERLTALESRTAGIQQGTSAQRDIRTEQLAERGFTHNAMVTVFIGLSLLVSIGSILLAAFKK